MSQQTPKPQNGIWSLVAPDGGIWNAPTPIQAVAKEQRERIPPQVALQNIFDAILPTEDEKRIAALQEAYRRRGELLREARAHYEGQLLADEIAAMLKGDDIEQLINDDLKDKIARISAELKGA